jgi:hypothetical protein
MAVEWRNDKQPVDGLYIVDVDAEDGSQVQTFKGASIDEVTDKLLAAQVNATRRINELKKSQTPDRRKATPAFKPRKLSAEEEFAATNDIRTGKVQEVVDRAVEASLGAPLASVRERLQREDQREANEAAAAAAEAFVQSTPEWYPTVENKLALWNYMEENNMDWTSKNFGMAFDHLMAGGLLEKHPETPEVVPEPARREPIAPQPVTRPRGSFATGVRSTDVGSAPPARGKPRYTRQEIETMPRSVYAQKMAAEPGFAAAVDALK